MKKKNKKKTSNDEIKFYSEEIKREKIVSDDVKVVRSFIIVLVILVVVLVGLFYINAKFISKDNFQEEATTISTTASYNHYKIVADVALKMSDKEYYVLFYNSDDSINYGLYNTLIQAYDSEDHNNINLYSVDLSDAMNKSHFNEDGESDIDNLIFNQETLIRVKSGKIVESVTEKEKINELLK